jgi:hypothetical protein
MHPVHEVDAVLLLAIAIASKRRPAVLLEIIAANDLICGSVSLKSELERAFHQLSSNGLISETGGGYELTTEALKFINTARKKADNEERLAGIKVALAAYHSKLEYSPVIVTEEQLSAAVHEHLLSKEHAGKNLLVPKPKPAIDPKRPLRRKPFPSRRKF